MNISFFDFDGTVTRRDSLVDFTQYSVGILPYYAGLVALSPMLFAYALKIIPNYRAKEKFISYFFKGWDSDRFQTIADKYALEKIDKITRPGAIDKIKWHQRQGDKVVIVSASIENWLAKWCEKQNVELVSTQLEIVGKKITGRFLTKNCHGAEKVKRIKEIYDLDQYDHVFAYGDSKGDRELLAMADTSFYKPFR